MKKLIAVVPILLSILTCSQHVQAFIDDSDYFIEASSTISQPDSKPPLSSSSYSAPAESNYFSNSQPIELLTAQSEIASPSINGATSVSHGTVQTNASGTPKYTDNWKFLVSSLDAPDKISNYIVNNFTYQPHGSDTPYSPEDLNKLRAGDCKDFTAFSGVILASHGYKGNQISFGYAKNLGHAATLYNLNGSDWIMSNGGVYGPIQNPTDLQRVARQIIEAPRTHNIGPILYYPLDYFGAYGIGDWSP